MCLPVLTGVHAVPYMQTVTKSVYLKVLLDVHADPHRRLQNLCAFQKVTKSECLTILLGVHTDPYRRL